MYKWLREASDKQQEEKSRRRKGQQESNRKEQEAHLEEVVTQDLDAKILVTNLKEERALSGVRE